MKTFILEACLFGAFAWGLAWLWTFAQHPNDLLPMLAPPAASHLILIDHNRPAPRVPKPGHLPN